MRRPEGDYAELLPWLLDQATDWEAAAAAGAAATPPLVPDTRCAQQCAPMWPLLKQQLVAYKLPAHGAVQSSMPVVVMMVMLMVMVKCHVCWQST